MSPLLPLWLSRRERVGKEDPAMRGARLARDMTTRPEGKLVWLHGASLGESAALMPLIERLLDTCPAHILLSVQTLSALSVMTERLADQSRCTVVAAPMDTPSIARRFVDHWRPDAVIFAESEIWPNLLRGVAERAIPTALVNGRMNESSLARWERRRGAARAVFGAFSVVLAAEPETGTRLSSLLDRPVPCPGNLKFAAQLGRANADEVAALSKTLGQRDIYCALSVHPEEVAAINTLAAQIDGDRPLMVVQPRYPDQADAYAGLDKERTYLLDGFGTTALACAVSKFAIVGGSLVPSLKGHNPIEPMQAGLAVASGPHVVSFAPIYADYFAAFGIDAEGSLQRAKSWFVDAEQLDTDGRTAKEFAAARAGLIETVMDHLTPITEALQ